MAGQTEDTLLRVHSGSLCDASIISPLFMETKLQALGWKEELRLIFANHVVSRWETAKCYEDPSELEKSPSHFQKNPNFCK